jgi:hypothetical protein
VKYIISVFHNIIKYILIVVRIEFLYNGISINSLNILGGQHINIYQINAKTNALKTDFNPFT